jgi:tetratricopeptide (TPR) repeat protein
MDASLEAQLDSYLTQRKYLTAAQLLDTIDPQNKDPEALIRKIHISINFFAQSLNHKMFAFKDLTENETILSVRKQGGTFRFVLPLDVPAAVASLIASNPNDGRLYSALGDFYADVLRRYGPNDPFPNAGRLAIDAYKKATTLGTVDAANQGALGLLSLQMRDYEAAEQGFKRAVSLQPDNPEYNYNLGFALMNLGKYSEAAEYSKVAYERYEHPELKRDALLMYGDTFLFQGRFGDALGIYDRILTNEPNNFFPLRRQMQCYVGLGRIEDIQKSFNNYLALGAMDPNAVSKLNEVFQTTSDIRIYIKLADAWLVQASNYATDQANLALGTVSYYEAFAYQAVEDQVMFRRRLLEAKSYLAKVLPAEHQLFKQIEKDLGN